MKSDFDDLHKRRRFIESNGPPALIRPPTLRRSITCFSFVASVALVAQLLAAGLPVRSHPLDRGQYVLPYGSVSSVEFKDLLDHRDFLFISSVSFLTTPTGSLQTSTSDVTWNNANNKVECIGGGAESAGIKFSSGDATGGGGGAYSKITNFTFATPGTT